MEMRFLLLTLLFAHLANAAVNMSESQIKQLGITDIQVQMTPTDSVGPFIGTFEFSDENSYQYTLNTEGTVIQILKKQGDHVRKGDVICRIASSELLSASYEIKELSQRYKIMNEQAQKDAKLYADGVISQRDAQHSQIEAAALKTKIAALTGRFKFVGADMTPIDGMSFTIRAKRSGVISLAPVMGGEKINPFTPYMKISDTNALNAIIMVSPKLIDSIQKGAIVFDDEGQTLGKVSAVGVAVNRTNNSAQVNAHITARQDSVRVGTSTEMYISVSQLHKWVVIPKSSLTKYKNKDICFIKTSKGFEPKNVEILKSFKNSVAVKPDGFTPKTRVANNGIINLKGALSGMGFE